MWQFVSENRGMQEAEKQFPEIQRAYAILSDEQQRAIYDAYGMKGIRAGAFSVRTLVPPSRHPQIQPQVPSLHSTAQRGRKFGLNAVRESSSLRSDERWRWPTPAARWKSVGLFHYFVCVPSNSFAGDRSGRKTMV